MDLQFINQKARDGTTINRKCIDMNSGFLIMESLKSKSPQETANFLQHSMPLLEKQSGFTIKNIRTDDGLKFKGKFEALLNEKGIIHQVGNAYDHHTTGKVERSHQTIQKRATIMLTASKLPTIFYLEAMKMAVYIFNRTIHNNNDKTPLQILLHREPKNHKFKKFGCICTAFIPKELRENDRSIRGTRCRFLGYTDDFDNIEKTGYMLLREDNGQIIKFHDNEEMTPIEGLEELFDSSTVLDPTYFEIEETGEDVKEIEFTDNNKQTKTTTLISCS
jgi:hypothetical protein